MNPLQQYFRRPVLYFSLPSNGRYYDNDVVDIPANGQLPVYPMTALDEITAKTPDALYNGAALADIISSCIPNVKNPWKINSIDLEAITVAIKIASTGEEMEIESTCPACKESSNYGVNLIEILSQQVDVNYEELIPVGELKIKYRPLNYTEINKFNIAQYETQKFLFDLNNFEDDDKKQTLSAEYIYKLNNIFTEMIADTIDSIITPDNIVTEKEYIIEFLHRCDKKTNEAVKKHSVDLKEKNSMKPLNIKCSNCQNEYKQNVNLNISDFFE